MALLNELGLLTFIRRRIEGGDTHKSLAEELRLLFPGVRGISARSVKRFCAEHNLHATSRLSDNAVDVIVAYGIGKVWKDHSVLCDFPPTSVEQVGPSYGRKVMTGFLSSQGFRVSQLRVGKSLKRVDPRHHSRRRNSTHSSVNPIPYVARYFGEKLHMDQNEKLIAFGVTHVCAVDGFSGKIVGFISMPVKSNGIIYDKLYR